MIADAEVAARVRCFEAATEIDKALDQSIEPPPVGIAIPVPLETLIERIYVAPTALEWFKDLVEKVARKYAVGAAVVQSGLVGKPVY